jgi:type VI secretion system secreted protein VgrG
MNDRVNSAVAAAEHSLVRLLAPWANAHRLYDLEGDAAVAGLLVERFAITDQIGEPFELDITALTLDARVSLPDLLGKRVTLLTTLADRSRRRHSGVVFAASMLGSDGGFTRVELTVRPWVAMLAHSRHSRVWQGKDVRAIVDDVLAHAAYGAHAAWRWGEATEGDEVEDVAAFLARGPNGGVRDFCCQYRESDLAFVQRLLASVGLGWRVEEHAEAPSGHRVVFFVDSAQWPQNPSSRGGGIRFHGQGPTQSQDAIQSFGGLRQLNPAATAVLQWDYLNKRAVVGDAPTNQQFGSDAVQDIAPWLQSYQPESPSADVGDCTAAQLQHVATLRQQAFEHCNKTWLGRSNLRSLRAGEWFTLTDSPLDALADIDAAGDDMARQFTVHRVRGVGLNNLPKELSERLAHSGAGEHTVDDAELWTQAAQVGHANRFEAVRRAIPWRPVQRPRPTAMGVQTAIVVGPRGNTVPDGAHELHTDRLGRIKVQFHWHQHASADARDDNRGSCWLRVAQRWGGAGIGQQFLPRIGQEVLLQFLDGDIDRPLVVGALHNGRGEGGLLATPGGAFLPENGADTAQPFSRSHDHRPDAQGNLVGSGSGGNAPAWHGGAPGEARPGEPAQNNAAALSGTKSKEFGGTGFNQLVFDDTPNALRVQLASTQHATQLNLGHLVHQADNHRGSFRGRGFELRTDAFGAVRAQRGLLITSYGAHLEDPAGDNAPGMALLKQAVAQADVFSRAASLHQTTALAVSVGSQRAKGGTLRKDAAPLQALQQSLSGMVDMADMESALSDAQSGQVQASKGKLPHTADPIVAVSAKAGLAVVAGQDIQLVSGDTLSWQAGQDLNFASGQQLRVHSGQSLGVLAGAVQAGDGAKGSGLTLIAGQGPVTVQAQSGPMQVAAKDCVHIQSATAHIDWAAAKKITLATAGGAQIVISGEGITVQCPGKITVRAASKSFVGPGSETYPLPALPQSVCKACVLAALRAGSPFVAPTAA